MYKIIAAGENSILIYFAEHIDPTLPAKIRNFANQLKIELNSVITNSVPAYTSLQVCFDLNKIDFQDFCTTVENLLNQPPVNSVTFEPQTIHIPVYYATEVGLDLARLLAEKNLDLNAFIALHSAQEYLIYAIGFSPAFAFLGEVDERIQAPRLVTPRIRIPAGSVGIANNQTAVYPVDSSGGWNIVGRTALDLSLSNAQNVEKFQVGNKVKFDPISRDDYVSAGGVL